MTQLIDCWACEIGDHDNHTKVVQAVPEGGIGGKMCPCKGECREDRAERQHRFLTRMGLGPLLTRGATPDGNEGK